MLRDELFHPAIVHFPIAFLAFSGALALFWLFFRRGQITLLLVLILGVAGGWLGILTGGWSEDVVNRVIGLVSDPVIELPSAAARYFPTFTLMAVLPFPNRS